MKLGVRISLIVCFFLVLAGLVWVSSVQTVELENEPVNNEKTEITVPTQESTRPPESATEAVKSAFTKAELENVDGIITDKLEEIDFNGTFLVAVGDEVIYHKAMGYSDKENKKKNTLDTKYEIGSCSKQFTATAIAKLAEEKQLSIKDKVTKYVKDAKIAEDVTIEHLLNMCSGLPDYLNEYIYQLEAGERDEDAEFSNKEFLNWLNKQELVFEPGEYFSYSNTNYYLLGLIIEEVSGETYEEYIQNEIFYPLYMDDSSLKMTDTNCKGYLDNEWTEGIKVDSSYFYSAGEIVSTTSDMLKWVNAYSRGKVLGNDMFKKATNTGSDGFNYGFGWFVCDDYYYHTGNTELYYAIDMVTKEDDIKVIGLSNINNTELQPTGISILFQVEEELFPGKHNVQPTEPNEPTNKS
ncbi:MAG: serine hydrolase domain-containing protein [Acutalibacteraceae bacterium]|nr:serine hydrolase domain-containing protein [Acutalibacteraceae bacterium]